MQEVISLFVKLYVPEVSQRTLSRLALVYSDDCTSAPTRKGRTEEKKPQNSHKFAHNEPHMGVCGSLCEFENVLFSKENRTHKSHVFAQCEQNNHA